MPVKACCLSYRPTSRDGVLPDAAMQHLSSPRQGGSARHSTTCRRQDACAPAMNTEGLFFRKLDSSFPAKAQQRVISLTIITYNFRHGKPVAAAASEDWAA